MNTTVAAYLAGAIDADGFISIRRSTYHRRVRGDAVNPVFNERVGFKQTRPQVPELLRDLFGGSYYIEAPQTPNSHPLYSYNATCRIAVTICETILPYLRIKRSQAEILLELRESKKSKYLQESYWFRKEFPDWKQLELITYSEASEILGYINANSVSQAVSNGTLLALPYLIKGKEIPRVPRLLVERLAANQGRDGKKQNQPPALVKWRNDLYECIKELNKIGLNGTPVYHRSGPYAPKD